MKKFLFFALISSVILACNSDDTDKTDTTQQGDSTSVVTDAQKSSLQEADTLIEFGNLVPGDEAMKFIRHYANTYKPGRRMSDAVWFSKDFIRYVSQSLEADTGVDGVRIYLGAYDAPGARPVNVVRDHPNQISLFWVATRPVGKGEHKSDTSFFKLPPFKNKSQLLNHGKLCPPDICGFD